MIMRPTVTALTRTFGAHSIAVVMREVHQPGLRRPVRRRHGRRPDAAHAADVDDRTAVALLHPVVGALRAEDRREQVEGDDPFGEPRRRRGGVGGRRTAGVVHEHVEAAEPFDDRVDGRPRRFAVTQVGGEERPVVGEVVDLLAGADRDGGAGVGEALRDAAAHSRVPPVTSTTLPP